ncbi:GNAT family N-acetyltransferase [Mucilaginibacter pocheonensis]|uniref:GNAT superfamily N-acetyltransferase n=1 Tax=Mucilaginibacter pocheonensis TaxID=398050 RepID=A0ABU1TIF6_9SPHI|nr:GNAT family N-acetyltransferase [Mucilaginibacter pocheonensis]MDR6945192.1 GNAT superfamily N-acetyltransferase [Mucilaginibacter pocheonensis]
MIHIEQIRPELTWRLRQKVLYPEQKLYEMVMEEDEHGLHFAAFKNDAIVAVISLFAKGDDYQFRKFAVDDSLQGTGIGKQMLDHITAFAKTNGAKRLWCNARLSAVGFYLKAGFEHTGQFFTRQGFDYEILEKNLTPLLAPQLT